MPKRNAQPFLRTSLGTPATTSPYIIRSVIRTPSNTITPTLHHPTLYNKECIHTHPPPYPHSKYFAHQTKNVALGAAIPTILCTFVAHNAQLDMLATCLANTHAGAKQQPTYTKDESTIQHFAHHVACPCLGHDSRKSNGTNQRHQLPQVS